MEQSAHQFVSVGPGLAYGDPLPAGWLSITSRPLLILVGVTGVGKSTTLDYLQQSALHFSLLPDRRELTDQLIIGYLQTMDGLPVQPVKDRRERFAYTRRYHQLFPGGMSHAVSQLVVDTATHPGWLCFDGLRGEGEVAHAARALPQARFVVLDAPDLVRVQRLLGRSDRFDQISSNGVISTATSSQHSLAAVGVADGDALFTPEEIGALLQSATPPVGSGTIAVEELRAKLQIVVEERRNYDPQAAIAYLKAHAPDRTLLIDTTQVAADVAAQQVVDWLL
ncbi:MAG: ATPase [Caldilinea sp. CFX5]|nr:ATPase [Caldilinea sp. CFX5]